MVKKEFAYRGKSLEELQKLSIHEFAALLPSRQRRSILRGFTEEQKIFLERLRSGKEAKTHCRELIILPELVGKMIKVHNGKDFVMLKLEAEMIGHRIGEFCLTRKRVTHNSPGVGATRSSSNVSVR
ncbi:MAG: 30S ribosomal protein S19 [Nanoarchaeota archaeon]|nr:30S ribosomal protein S19 [Nanoarchaeota archaeon]